MADTHISILEHSAAKFSSAVAFRIPQVDASSNLIQQWRTVTYKQFLADVESFARHWGHVLQSQHIPRRTVIGLWIGGYTYVDLVHIYGVSRAGYIPQLFSLRLPNPDVIFELLQKSSARALIYEPSYASVLTGCPIPSHSSLVSVQDAVLRSSLVSMPEVSLDDVAFFFHTSGSTSGSPKLVPYTFRWLDSAIRKSYQSTVPRDAQRPVVTTWMGSMCHVGQTFMLLGRIQHGSCTIQPSTMLFSRREFESMIADCGLTHLSRFAAFLSVQLKEARKDAKLLSLLCGLEEVMYSGMPLAPEEEDWAYQSGISIRNIFGSTENGGTMISVGGHGPFARLLKPLDGTSYAFVPIEGQTDSSHKSTNRMLEFIILADSGDCVHKSLRSADGHFHTGDLFIEPTPGHYMFRGRDDDWIKSENSLRCDTKTIEDNVQATCASLISACIVVGTGRPSPVLFIEPSAPDVDAEKLKKDIIRKTRQFHSRRYLHERITSTRMIVVVPAGSLPRTATKGNIRRKLVEEKYCSQLDEIFADVAR